MALGEARTHVRFFVILNIILGTASFLQLMVALADGFRNVSGAALFLFIIGGALAPTCVISVFRELHNPQQSDVVYALPMSAKERYTSRILAIFYLHLAPAIVWSGLTTVITIVLGMGKQSWTDYDALFWVTRTSPRGLLQMFLLYLTAVLFFEAVSVICTVCCGRRAEMRYFTYMAAFSISVAPLLIRSRLMEEMGGQVTSPGVIYYLWSFTSLFEYSETMTSLWKLALITIASTLISLGVIALMFLLYRKRDAGTAGKPVVSRVFFELVILAGVVTFYTMYLFEGSPETVVAMTGIVYMVIHLVTFREVLSGKKVVWWFAKFVGTTVLFFALVFAAYLTDGFGAINYMPARNLDRADIIVAWENPMGLYGDNGGYLTAYAGTHRYLSSSNSVWYNHLDFHEKELTDAEVRKAVGIVRKYAKEEKSLKDFYDRLWGTETYYGWGRNWDRGERFKIYIWLPGNVNDPVMEQELWISEGDATDLLKELEKSGLMNLSRAWE